MQPPYFSVVIPTLNEARYISKLLTALVNQDFRDFEVIVVDAKSADRTKQLVKSYQKDLSLKFLVSRHRNPAIQRNLGARKAVGKYLVFFDADVVIKANYLAELKRQLTKDKIDCATTRAIPDTRNPLIQLVAIVTNWFLWFMNQLKQPLMSGQNMLIKRAVFNQVKGFDATCVHSDDFDLVKRISRNEFRTRVLFHPQHIMSLRRIEREGWIKSVAKCFYATCYFLLKGAPKKKLFAYPLGGEVSL